MTLIQAANRASPAPRLKGQDAVRAIELSAGKLFQTECIQNRLEFRDPFWKWRAAVGADFGNCGPQDLHHQVAHLYVQGKG